MDPRDEMFWEHEMAEPVTEDMFEVLVHEAGSESDVLRELREATEPIPGRPGWRQDEDGREWYSAAWLNTRVGSC